MKVSEEDKNVLRELFKQAIEHYEELIEIANSLEDTASATQLLTVLDTNGTSFFGNDCAFCQEFKDSNKDRKTKIHACPLNTALFASDSYEEAMEIVQSEGDEECEIYESLFDYCISHCCDGVWSKINSALGVRARKQAFIDVLLFIKGRRQEVLGE